MNCETCNGSGCKPGWDACDPFDRPAGSECGSCGGTGLKSRRPRLTESTSTKFDLFVNNKKVGEISASRHLVERLAKHFNDHENELIAICQQHSPSAVPVLSAKKKIESMCGPCLNILILEVGAWRFRHSSQTSRAQLRGLALADPIIKQKVLDFKNCGCGAR